MQETTAQQSDLRALSVCDEAVRNSWHEPFAGLEPAVICIHGPYVNVSMLRRLGDCVDMSKASEWSDSHSDDRGPQHHDHSEKSKSRLEPLDPDVMTNLREDRVFAVREEVRLRPEGTGAVAAMGFNGFAMNAAGRDLLSSCIAADGCVTIRSYKDMCRRLGVSEEAGLSFLRRLYALGVVSFS